MKRGLISALLLSAAIPAISAAAPGETRADAQPVDGLRLKVPLVIGDAVVSDIDILIQPDGQALVHVEQLLSAAGSRINADAQAVIRNRADGQRFIDPRAFETPSISVAYNEALGQVETTLSADISERREITLFDTDRFDFDLYRKSSRTAGFINVFAAARHASGGRSQTDVSALIDGGFRMMGTDGVALRAELDIDTARQNTVRRGEVFLFKDDATRARRYSAGDLFIRTVGQQAGGPFAGLAVEKTFAIRPRLNTQPLGETSFLLERDSIVRVMINGAPVRTLRLPAGPYDISNFPFVDGLNDVAIEVEDDVGVRETIRFSQFFNDRLLRKGLHEYGYYLGVARESDGGEIVYNGDEWLGSFFHRMGLSDSLTLGVNGQANESVQQLGADAIWASPAGTIQLEAASSVNAQSEVGYAVNLDFALYFERWNPAWSAYSAQVSAFYLSEEFADLATPDPTNDTSFTLSSVVTFPLPAEISGSLAMSRQFSRTDQDRTIANLSLSRRLTDRMNGFLSFNFEDSPREDNAVSIIASVTMRLGERQTATARYDSQNDVATANWFRSNPGRVGGYGLSAQLRHELEEQETELDFNADYTGNRFIAAVNQTAGFEEGFGELDSLTRVSAAGAIAFADGEMAFGRPIRGAFAIVKPHPTLADATIEVGRNAFGPDARTDGLGPALVPNVLPYQERSLEVGVIGAPLGYDIGDARVALLAPEVGGYVHTVGSADSLSAIGVLSRASGEPVAYGVGEVIRVGDPDYEPRVFFTNAAGRFAVQRLRPGDYEVTLNEGGRFAFTIERGSVGAVMVGDIELAATEQE